jgi:large repetitive protein
MLAAMTRWAVTGLASAFVVAVVVVPPVSGRQVVGGVAPPVSGQPQRDVTPPPANRRVPVGTATITGTITAADSGRPVRGVRVTVNGNTAPLSSLLTSPARAGGAAGPTVIPSARGGMTVIGSASQIQSGVGGMSASRTAITDAQGVFVIEHLPAGQYSISASRTSYLTTSYGQKRPAGPGSIIPVADGQKLNLTLQLIRGGVISGTVFNEDGEPMAQSQVQVWRLAMNNGMKRLQRSNGTSTDDRGAYRISGLQPGDYLVSATANNSDAMMADRMLADTALIEAAIASGAIQPPGAPGQPATVAIPVPQTAQNRLGFEGQPLGFVPVFHPANSEARNATMIHVAGGDEHRFIDIQVRPITASNIVGSVTNLPGQDLGVQLMLINEDSFIDTTNSARVEENGQFVFRNVSPGKYTILADVVPQPRPMVVNGVSTQRVGPLPPLEDSQKWWGRESVSVEGQGLVPVSITLRPGRSISGSVIFEMARPPDLTRQRITVSLQVAPDSVQTRYSQLPQAQVGPDGRFTINGVSPGRYQIRASGFMKSAFIDGKDTLDFPFDFTGESDVMNAQITLTDQISEIGGTLTDMLGKPGADETIIIASTDDRHWTPGSRRIAYTRARVDGQYVFRNLPAGTYMIAVVTDLDFGMQYDPELLKSIAASTSTRVTLGDGEKVVKDLRVSR